MLNKIYQELVFIRKELQSIRRAVEPKQVNIEPVIHLIQESLKEQTEESVHSRSEKS